MLVYRAAHRTIEPVRALVRLAADARALAAVPDAHDRWVELLIDAGELEAGVGDALCPEVDDDLEALHALRELTVRAARAVCRSWWGAARDELRMEAHELEQAACGAERLRLPAMVRAGIPEGFVHYAVYPESYAEAARRFAREVRPRRAVCLGIRSIGTSLAATVAAALEAHGCEVRGWSVRPRGAPFDRGVRFTPALARALREWRDAHWAIVDEGPGLSGSSFAGTAAALSALGVPDERIVFFPSWVSDGTSFVNAVARERWWRHRAYHVGFEELWIESGRIARLAGAARVADLSAGRWREHGYADVACHPAVQPQHEQRKYLAHDRAARRRHDEVLLKFSGLGRYGRARYERATQLAEAGFAPRAHGVLEGFLVTEYVRGAPVSAAEVDGATVERMADYLAFVRASFPARREAGFDVLLEMVRVNAAEGLGGEWGERAGRWGRARDLVEDAPAVAIDGRMLPHEWIRTARGLLKTDGLAHHDHHFFPGCQDIAWDLAGASVECALDGARERALVERYVARSCDASIVARLPFHRVAYLAFRLGYTSLAAQVLGDAPDGARMRALALRYADGLRRALASGAP